MDILRSLSAGENPLPPSGFWLLERRFNDAFLPLVPASVVQRENGAAAGVTDVRLGNFAKELFVADAIS